MNHVDVILGLKYEIVFEFHHGCGFSSESVSSHMTH